MKKSKALQILNNILKFIASIPSRITKFIKDKLSKMKKEGKPDDEISECAKKMKEAANEMNETAKSAAKTVQNIKDNIAKNSTEDLNAKQQEAVNKAVEAGKRMSKRVERMCGEVVNDSTTTDFAKIKAEAVDAQYRNV